MSKQSLSELIGKRKIPAKKSKLNLPARKAPLQKKEANAPVQAQNETYQEPVGDLKSFLIGSPKKTTSTPPPAEPKKEEKPVALIDVNNFTYEGQPEKLEEIVVAKYQEGMEILRTNIDDKELVGQSLYSILGLLQEHSFLKGNLADEDVGMMIEALKASHRTVLLEKSTRKSTPKGKAAVALKEAENMLEGLDFGDI